MPHGAAKNTQCWMKKLQYLGLDKVALPFIVFTQKGLAVKLATLDAGI